MRTVLFVCVENAGRSQMAEAFFNNLAPEGIRATSAGTKPAKFVNPKVVQLMKELGIDISKQRPKLLTEEMVKGAERVVILCGRKACPAIFHPTIEDWDLKDPAKQPLEKVREIRDEIERRVKVLVKSILESTLPDAQDKGPHP